MTENRLHGDDNGRSPPRVEAAEKSLSSAGANPSQDTPQQTKIEYLPFKEVLVIMLGLFISAFLVALNRTIIGTAIPKITDDFHSLGDVCT